MAKKKVSQTQQEKTKPLPKREEIVKRQQQETAAMESEASEKLESLKSLNQMLLKEAFERRQQVDSLIESKESLESELTRSNWEREKLKSDLTQLSERAARLELERSVVHVFVAEQVGARVEVAEEKMKGLEREVEELNRVIGENESEIGRLNGILVEMEGKMADDWEVSRRVWEERDDFRDKLELQIVEGNGLRANLNELEELKRKIEIETGELQVAFDALVEEKEERELQIEALIRQKESIEMSLLKSNNLIEEMRGELYEIVKEKEGIEGMKNLEIAKRLELEKVVSGLNEMVVGLQKEEEKLRVIVAELEKKCVEGEGKQKGMDKEIDQLVKERKFSEEKLEVLINEKSVLDKDLAEAHKQIAELRRWIEEMGSEKNAVVEAKDRVECEVGVLQNQVFELKGVISKMEESNGAQLEKMRSLESEIKDYKCALDHVKVERGEMGTRLGEEKQNAVRLKEKIDVLEKRIEKSLNAVDRAKVENAAISEQKMELMRKYEMLKKELTSLENELTEARKGIESMKGKVELADSTSETVLNMLKDTVTFCSKDETDAGNCNSLVTKQISGEEKSPFVMEFETIKNAFKSKETKVENMKRQLEFLQRSVEEAHKKKSFWTVLSSATTLLAAVSLAYVARGH